MDGFLKVMKAVSDGNRVKILKALQHKSMCVCELQAALGIAQPTVSKHLRILVDAGLVLWTRDGKWIDYHLADGSASPYAAVMLGNLRHWLDDDPAIDGLGSRIPHLCREHLCGVQPLFEDESYRSTCMS